MPFQHIRPEGVETTPQLFESDPAFHRGRLLGIFVDVTNRYPNKLTVYGYPYSFSSSSSVSKIAPKTPVNVVSADCSFLEINFLWYNVAISSSNFWIFNSE